MPKQQLLWSLIFLADMVLFTLLLLQASKDQTKFTMDTDEVKITKWQLNWLKSQQIL